MAKKKGEAREKAKARLKVSYSPEQQVILARLTSDVTEHLADKPRRLAHSLSVAKTA